MTVDEHQRRRNWRERIVKFWVFEPLQVQLKLNDSAAVQPRDYVGEPLGERFGNGAIVHRSSGDL